MSAGTCSAHEPRARAGVAAWGGGLHVEGAGEVGAAVVHPLAAHLHAQRCPHPGPPVQPHCHGTLPALLPTAGLPIMVVSQMLIVVLDQGAKWL